jgi:hypothetical protein
VEPVGQHPAAAAAMMRARVGRLWRRRADRVDAARTARRGGVIDYYSGGGGGGGGYRFYKASRWRAVT